MTATRQVRIEWAFVTLIGLGLVYIAVCFHRYGYLPQPYLANPGDTLMDGYYTAWWAVQGHVYDIWRAVYPPLSFVVLRLIALPQCRGMDPIPLRDCDWSLPLLLCVFFAINAVIAFRAFRMTNRTTAWPRVIALTLGLPSLFALDRGQMLILSTTAFFLAYGPGLRSARGRMLAAGIAVNFKPYLIAPLVGQLLRGRWRWVEGALLCFVLIWLASAVLFGEGDPVSLIDNLVNFNANAGRGNNWTFAATTTSYQTIIRFLSSNAYMAVHYGPWGGLTTTLQFMLFATQILSVAMFVMIWLRRHPVSRARMALLFYALVAMSSEVGRYAETCLIFLVFLERWKGARIVAICCAYMLCISCDATILTGAFPHGYVVESWLSGRPATVMIDMTIGAFVRPGLILAIQIALLVQVWNEMQAARSKPAPVRIASA